MAENFKIYRIQKGDNLTKISKMFNTTVDELVKMNNIADKNLIYADTDLKVPKSEEELAAEVAAEKAAADKAAAEAAAKLKAAKAAAEKVAAEKKAAAEKEEAENNTLKGKISNLFKKDK